MKVYVLNLVLGKATNYDENGKLKNATITSKYAGEMELENILIDQNWKKIGACEITCVNVYDSINQKVFDVEAIKAINARINKDIQAGIRPKTELELMKEQIVALTNKINNPVVLKNQKGEQVDESDEVTTSVNQGTGTEKDYRESLFAEAKKLGLTPAKNVKTDILKDLVTKEKLKIN